MLGAVLLSVYLGRGSLERPVFNVAGPLLSLSAAMLLAGREPCYHKKNVRP